MSDTMIDLGARKWRAGVFTAVVLPVAVALGVFCLGILLLSREALPVRLVAGAIGVLALTAVVGALRTRGRRPRWMVVDHEGVRLMNGRRRCVVRLAWGDLAGLGIMTNEAALRRLRMAAQLQGGVVALQSVSVWMEAYPAGLDARRRHPEMNGYWRLGTVRAEAGVPGAEQRWLIRLSDGLGQADLPGVVADHVQRWRPQLWRGHRSGSVLLG